MKCSKSFGLLGGPVLACGRQHDACCESTANTHDDNGGGFSNGPALDAPVATGFESCIIFSCLCFGLILCYCAK